MEPSKSSVNCDICKKSYANTTSLYEHKRTVHKVEPKFLGTTKCSICHDNVYGHSKLLSHLKAEHNIECTNEELEFSSRKEFEQWKAGVEKETTSQYIIRMTHISKSGNGYIYYHCNRDGCYTDKLGDKRKKRMKSMGTNKIGFSCPAHINVHLINGHYKVSFYKTHIGHSNMLGRKFLTKEQRREIANLIASGISFQNIIEKFRVGGATENLDRIHLVTKSDLRNIKKEFNLHSVRQYPNDEFHGEVPRSNFVPDDDSSIIYESIDTIQSTSSVCISSENDDLIVQKINMVIEKYQSKCLSDYTKTKVKKILDDIVTLMDTEEMMNKEIQKNKEPQNKKVEKRQRLFSTKKKTAERKKLTKSTQFECRNLMKGSQQNEILVLTDFDHAYHKA